MKSCQIDDNSDNTAYDISTAKAASGIADDTADKADAPHKRRQKIQQMPKKPYGNQPLHRQHNIIEQANSTAKQYKYRCRLNYENSLPNKPLVLMLSL